MDDRNPDKFTPYTLRERVDQWKRRHDRDGNATILTAGTLIQDLFSEISRLTAECQKWREYHDCEYRERKKYRQDANHFAGEVQRLTAELKEREGEVEKLAHERDLWENMAAMRLADQEAIERHTARRVAGEICEYLCKEWPFMGAGAVMDIKERYGVE